MKRFPRKTVNLPESVHKQLNSYAVAAGAAGVSLLALGQPSEAKIVYSPILLNFSPRHSYSLNLGLGPVAIVTLANGGGCIYFSGDICTANLRGFFGSVAFYASATSHGSPYYNASALVGGSQIGSQLRFTADRAATLVFLSSYRGISVGQWRNVTNRYLGIRFKINGQFHYGWARLNVRVVFSRNAKGPQCCHIAAILTGYAYETVPNKAIIAGATKESEDAEATALNTHTPAQATLGMLALGAPGLSIWRRKESSLNGQ